MYGSQTANLKVKQTDPLLMSQMEKIIQESLQQYPEEFYLYVNNWDLTCIHFTGLSTVSMKFTVSICYSVLMMSKLIDTVCGDSDVLQANF